MTSTVDQLHSMARRHHATMKKLDGMRATFAKHQDRFVSTLETGTGALFGGLVTGKLGENHSAVVRLLAHPLTLGVTALVTGYSGAVAEWSEDLVHFGNGYVGSYLAAKGFAFGARLRA